MNIKTKAFVLLLGGSGTRCGLPYNKVLHKINGIPLFMYSLDVALKCSFDEYILVVNSNDLDSVNCYLSNYSYQNIKVVIGGLERLDSVKNGLKEVVSDIAFIHDSARPLLSKKSLLELMNKSNLFEVGYLYSDVYDTIRLLDNRTIDRNTLLSVSTPQFFSKNLFDKILSNKTFITDEVSLFEQLDIARIKCNNNIKVTTKEDLDYVTYMLSTKYEYVIGHSLDYHPFSDYNELILGGVKFKDYKQLLGHSDADVLYHSVTEAIMGACNLGDLGTLFPDTDNKYKGMDSSYFLKEVMNRIKDKYELVNIDSTLYLQKPNLKDYKAQMVRNVQLLTNTSFVSVKAATLNKEGLIATNKGIGAETVVLLKRLK